MMQNMKKDFGTVDKLVRRRLWDWKHKCFYGIIKFCRMQ